MAPETHPMLDSVTPAHSGSMNFRRQSPPIAYSCVLLLSTAVAACFCYLYLSKPVIQIVNHVRTDPPPPREATESGKAPAIPREPEKDRGIAKSKAPTHGNLEETNLRIQHILTAESADGRVDRIELTVPVLYQSRSMLWTESEVETARMLHHRLNEHRVQTQKLRDEGKQLLSEWNELIIHSIPTQALRADSPSLPINQKDALEISSPAGWTTDDLIEVKKQDP